MSERVDFMKEFDPKTYFLNPDYLTEIQRLQREVALIVCTSIDGAESSLSKISDKGLAQALKLEKRKSLIKKIEREIRKRQKVQRCQCCDPVHPGDNQDCPVHGINQNKEQPHD